MAEKKFDLTSLVELQLIEKNILKNAVEINRLKKNENLQKLKMKFAIINEDFDKADRTINSLEQERKKIEDTIKSQEQKIKQINEKLFSGTITSSKELVNYQDEIKQLQSSNNNLEDREIEIMMEIDEKRPKLKELAESKNILEKEINDITKDIESRIKEIEKNIEVLKKKRISVSREIPSDILDRFDEIKQKKSGIAVAVLKNNFCDVCRVELPVQQLDKIKDPEVIHKCPMCGRMLVIHSEKIKEIESLLEN